ncbi:hypothetical protein EV426DRAFT_706465 [Tirmania nivea]|nr:hypothetical protein EV426DRAFT_706465 [Tirmania nivea]
MPSAWVMETYEALLPPTSKLLRYPQDIGCAEEEGSFDVEVVSESSSDDPASISESPVSSASVMASASASPSVPCQLPNRTPLTSTPGRSLRSRTSTTYLHHHQWQKSFRLLALSHLNSPSTFGHSTTNPTSSPTCTTHDSNSYNYAMSDSCNIPKGSKHPDYRNPAGSDTASLVARYCHESGAVDPHILLLKLPWADDFNSNFD